MVLWRVTQMRFVAALTLVSCRGCDRGDLGARDAAPAISVAPGSSGPSARVAHEVALDGPFTADATPKGGVVVAALGQRGATLGLVRLGADGTEGSRQVLLADAQAAGASPSLYAFADGSAGVVFQSTTGTRALRVGVQGELAGPPLSVIDACGTEEALVYVDAKSKRLHRWSTKTAPQTMAAILPEGGHLLCGSRAAFVVVGRGRGFSATAEDGRSIVLVDGVDPNAEGASAFYASDATLGVVAEGERGALLWATWRLGDTEPKRRTLATKIGEGQTLSTTDGTDTQVAVLFSKDERGRCDGDGSATYDLLLAGAPTGERVVAVPRVPCDRDATPPELAYGPRGPTLRWLEWSDERGERQMKSLAVIDAEPARAVDTRLPTDAVPLDCAELPCAAVTRIGGRFRVVR